MSSNRIFVFGSNLAGIHGAGSAKAALQQHGARWSVGVGRTGNAYAIPTKDHEIRTMPIDEIAVHVSVFLGYARANPALTFDVVKIGCGLAGFTEAEMSPLFSLAPFNVNLPAGWRAQTEAARDVGPRGRVRAGRRRRSGVGFNLGRQRPMSTLLDFTTTLATETCFKCGMLFAMPADVQRLRRADHQSFYCPAGHPQYYPGKSDAEKLRDQLAQEKHFREQAEARVRDQRAETERITRRLNATRGVVTRHKRKIAAGQCPCCSASFTDLAKHMKTRHPKWDPTKEAEVRSHD